MSKLSLKSEFESYASVVREKLTEAERGVVASEFVQAVTAGRAAVDLFKRLSTLVDEIKDAEKRGELMRIIGDLKYELGQNKIDLANEKEESNSLKMQIKALQDEIEKLKDPGTQLTIGPDGLYYTPENDGPFCTACYDNKRKVIRVVSTPKEPVAFGRYRCPVCNAKYTGTR